MRRRTKMGIVAVVVVIALFFCVPVVNYNPFNYGGHASGYESLSCALFNVGISYGYHSFFANDWVFMLSCGFIHVST
jgi:hypothetical protein